MINEVTYRLVARTLAIQFRDTFVEHFSLHQFSVTTHGECETVVHDVQTMLHSHPNLVVLHVDVRNTFNSMSRSTIFQELWSSPSSLD